MTPAQVRYQAKREDLLAYQRSYVEKHREQYDEYQRNYYQENKQKIMLQRKITRINKQISKKKEVLEKNKVDVAIEQPAATITLIQEPEIVPLPISPQNFIMTFD